MLGLLTLVVSPSEAMEVLSRKFPGEILVCVECNLDNPNIVDELNKIIFSSTSTNKFSFKISARNVKYDTDTIDELKKIISTTFLLNYFKPEPATPTFFWEEISLSIESRSIIKEELINAGYKNVRFDKICREAFFEESFLLSDLNDHSGNENLASNFAEAVLKTGYMFTNTTDEKLLEKLKKIQEIIYSKPVLSNEIMSFLLRKNALLGDRLKELQFENYFQKMKIDQLEQASTNIRPESAAYYIKSVTNFYKNEYEILPLWYKRLGHIIKVIMGKRTFGSLFNDKVKKYRD